MTYLDALVIDPRFGYVWPCFALAVLAMAGLAVDALVRLKRASDAAKAEQ